jgi:hypothetical protein
VTICVNNIEQTDNVRISHFLEERDFANGGAWDAFIFSFEADLLQGDDSTAIGEVSSFVNDTVGAWKMSEL